jgi:hypothetical protein
MRPVSIWAALATCAIAGIAVGQATDDCASAPVVGDGTYTWDLTTATFSVPGSCGGTSAAEDVFLQYVPTFTGTARASTCGATSEDTVLAIYADCAGTELACLDDFCGLQTQLDFPVASGVPYWVRIASFSGGATGSGTITLSQVGGGGTPPNDACGSAAAATDGVVYNFDTSAATLDGWLGSCGGSGGSVDVWYDWTPANTGCGSISLCGSFYDTVVEVFDMCGGVSLGCNDDYCGLQSQLDLTSVAAGTHYIVRVSGYSGASGAGQILFTSAPAGSYSPPGSGTVEPEVCDPNQGPNDTVNGGCNVTPNLFGSVACGETILGTAWSTTSYRDTDWFLFHLPADDTVTMTGQAQFFARCFLLNTDCTNLIQLATGTNSACDPNFSISASLTAGDYVAWMGAAAFDGLTVCGTNSQYWFTLSFGAGCAGNPCDFADTNCDGAINGFDVEATEQAVNGDFSNFCLPTADLNGDGAENGFDVEYSEQLANSC